MTIRKTPLIPTLAALTLLAACGGGGGGGGGGASAPAATDVLIQDAPADELLSFSAVATELRLRDDQGGDTANLLPAALPLELIGLADVPAWLARMDVPPATYRSVVVRFQPGSAAAVDRNGNAVAVNQLGNELVADLPAPQALGGSYGRLVVDLDLALSLSGDVATPPLDFVPQGTTSTLGGAGGASIDEIRGVVTSFSQAGSSLVIDAFADDDLSVALGPVTVSVSPTTVLVRDDGGLFGSVAAFFGVLQANATLLEVHGLLSSAGTVQAQRIEVEDQSGGAGSANRVKIEGLIADLDPVAQTLELLIREIEKGASIAGPVLAGLGNPSSITVSWDAMTVFFLEDHMPTSASSLAFGQEIKAKFPLFVNEPFRASQIEIEDFDPEVEGRVTDVSGLPGSFVMRAFGNEPAVTSGAIASSTTDVVVDLTGSTLFLDTENDPALQPSQILAGLKVEVRGPISGPPSAPTIAASRTKIHAGRFDGLVAAISPGTHSFDATVTDLDDPFGNNVTSPPFHVVIAPGAVFDDEASSEASFYALFNGLQGGETLEVRVEGIGSGVANEVLAYEIEAEVE